MTEPLKLIALGKDDLNVISAHVQDAVVRSADIEVHLREKLVAIPMNRFAWETPSSRRWLFKKHERRRSVLHFSTVLSVKSRSVDRQDSDQILSLLSVTFAPSADKDDPSGTIDLTFSGGSAIVLEVECIEAQISDLGAAWSATNKPRHSIPPGD